jgi:hypothetical protein
MTEIGQVEAGDFLVSVQPDGPYFAVLVIERKGVTHFYVDLVEDPRFAWFEWTKRVPTFETILTADHLVEYNDRVNTRFHKIGQPLQRLTASSVERLIDLCEKLSKGKRKK